MKDSPIPSPTPNQAELFGTKQAAHIVGVPEWRIKNFSEGSAYHLLPTVRVGSGRGGRRLYSLSDLYRLAIANELVTCGFTPEAIGRAMQAVPAAALKAVEAPAEESEGKRQRASILFLVQHSGEWSVQSGKAILRLMKHTAAESWHGHLFVLALRPLIEQVLKRKKQYNSEEW